MSIRDDFLDEIQAGDYVEITYGQQGARTIAGTVLRITSSMVRLQCEDRSPRIALESIISYDTPEPGPAAYVQVPVQETRAPVRVPAPPVSAPAPSAPPAQSAPPAPPAQPQVVVRLRDAEVQHYMDICLNSYRPGDDEIADWDALVRGIQEDCSPEVRGRLNGIVDGFQSIRKQFSQSGDTRDLENKIHDLRARVLRLIQSSPEDGEYLCGLLGSMHFQLKDFEKAAQYFAASHDYEGAYYAAASGENREKCPEYLEEYVREDGNVVENLLLLYARQAAERKDVSALRERLDPLRERDKLDEDEREDVRTLISCAAIIADTAGLPQDWLTGTAGRPEVDRFEAFFKALPEDWRTVPEPPPADAVPEKDEDDREYISTITAFYVEKCIGFLPEPNGGRDCFFHVKQVVPEGPLRTLLANGQSHGLQVSYRHGTNFDGQKAATEVRLTPAGLKLAEQRMNGEGPHERLTGDLDTYDRKGDLYWINLNRRGYPLRADGIADPYLKVYLGVRFNYHIRVEFELRRVGGREVAYNARLAKDAETVSATEIQQALRENIVTQEELDGWTERKRLLDQELEDPRIAAEVAVERFASMPYIELPIWRFSLEKQEEPRPQRGPARPAAAGAVSSPTPAPTVSLPPLEPMPPHENRFRDLPPIRSVLREGLLYETAQNMLQSNRLRDAEEYYIRSIQAGERVDSAVLGLENLYLRDENRMLDAVDLIEVYGDMLDADKRRNQEIAIYQKGRERPFKIKLCHLLEAGLEKAPRVSVKLHYLALQGNTLRQLGEYEAALDSYRRWRALYDNEVKEQGLAAVRQLTNGLNAVRRGEASCYYLLGKQEQAVAIANELLRVTPGDPTALEIIDGTFGKPKAAAAEAPGKADIPGNSAAEQPQAEPAVVPEAAVSEPVAASEQAAVLEPAAAPERAAGSEPVTGSESAAVSEAAAASEPTAAWAWGSPAEPTTAPEWTAPAEPTAAPEWAVSAETTVASEAPTEPTTSPEWEVPAEPATAPAWTAATESVAASEQTAVETGENSPDALYENLG